MYKKLCLLLITNKKQNKGNNMNNIKKIGLTALAGSLVATSVAYAGAVNCNWCSISGIALIIATQLQVRL